MNSVVDIYFSIRSDHITPDFVTKYLKLAPSSTCIKGVSKRAGQSPAKENVWTIRVMDSDQLDMEEKVQKLVNILLPVKYKLMDIAHQCNFDVECVVHVHGGSTTPVINFKADVVQFFAEVGADLGIDVYCLTR